MANFQDNRILGLSSRTLWVSLAVFGVVVGLFFIPEIMFQFAGKPGDKTRVTQKSTAPSATSQSQDKRASLSPDALKSISAGIDGDPKEHQQPTSAPAPKGGKRLGDVDASKDKEEGGIFSGWNVQVKARGDGSRSTKGVSMENLGSKESVSFFKRGRSDVSKFLEKNPVRGADTRELSEAFIAALDTVASGIGKGVDSKEVAANVQRVHGALLSRLTSSGMDRGVLMQWLDIPVVSFIEQSSGGNAREQIESVFAPRIVLRSLAIRQKNARANDPIARPSAAVTAELAVHGTDVDRIALYIAGQRQRDIKPGRADADGFRTFKVRGEGSGIWSFIAYDKFGNKPFQKSYSFYPRVTRFRRNADGSFNIAFRPGSAKNSLDRYFYAGGSRPSSRVSTDPAIGTF